MQIDHEGIKPLPEGATHIYVAVLHPDIQKVIEYYDHLAGNVYIHKTRVYIAKTNTTFYCLNLVTY